MDHCPPNGIQLADTNTHKNENLNLKMVNFMNQLTICYIKSLFLEGKDRVKELFSLGKEKYLLSSGILLDKIENDLSYWSFLFWLDTATFQVLT